MKKIFILLLLASIHLAAPISLRADASDPTLWQYYLSYHNATQTIAVGNKVYALSNGHLLCYDQSDESVSYADKMTVNLSGETISYFGYSDTQKCFVLLYEDKNIDLYYPDDQSIVNIPQVKNFAEYTISVTNFNVNGDYAAISTTEGIIVVDLAGESVKGYYRIGEKLRDATVSCGVVYAAAQWNVITGKLSENLYDRSLWTTTYTEFQVSKFVPYGNALYMLVPVTNPQYLVHNGIKYLAPPTDAGERTLTQVSKAACTNGSVNGKHIQFVGSGSLVCVNGDAPTSEEVSVQLGFTATSVSRTANGTYFFAQDSEGLVGYNRQTDGDTPVLRETGEVVGNTGPASDNAYRLLWTGNTLYVCGGTMDYADMLHNPGFVGRLRAGNWSDMDAATATAATPYTRYRDITSVAVNPLYPDSVVASAYGAGLYQYYDDKFVCLYNNTNSLIVSAAGVNAPHYSRVSGCTYDSEGNLWMVNTNADSIIVVRQANGKWNRIYAPSLADSRTAQNIFIDSNGYVWVACYSEHGLLGLNYNGTIARTSDDRSYYRSSATNEDGTTCDIIAVCPPVEDKSGHIWLGTNDGIRVITDPASWFTTSFTILQPKVPRNDGTNYADYLLSGVKVTAIAVDEGNQKWIGTSGAGIYLVNADGTEILAHITSADTPLLSDEINALAIDHTTGTLYIGTYAGLCSYRMGVTKVMDNLSKSHIKVWPNPVRPEYQGNVTIAGLTEGAEVKILSAGSQLVARGKAVGGSFVWDVRSTASGRRVAPGVYFIMVATSDGKEGVAAKVAVI